MRCAAWNKAFEVGIDEFDADHREIFQVLEGLYAASVRIDDVTVMDKAIGVLIARLEAHFAREESAMTAASYRNVERHRETHQEDLRYVRTLADAMRASGRPPQPQTIQVLMTWFLEHVRTMDMEFASELRNWK